MAEPTRNELVATLKDQRGEIESLGGSADNRPVAQMTKTDLTKAIRAQQKEIESLSRESKSDFTPDSVGAEIQSLRRGDATPTLVEETVERCEIEDENGWRCAKIYGHEAPHAFNNPDHE